MVSTNEYGTRVSVLARDPLLAFAAGDYKPSQECKSRSYCWCTIITRMQQLMKKPKFL
ncbi:unnamed protein product [Brassica rapa]|uniref:Uncharacterized protein n=1 Tax=Brassica campestris TaxID=3711 RepID=A0A8D9H2T0_BRACM|nr:unnamed protein product [Brassica rapa]